MEFRICERLKEIRRESGYTQKKVAELVNKSETGYASWEQGLAEPSVCDLRKLCSIFDVSADYLLGIDDSPCTSVKK